MEGKKRNADGQMHWGQLKGGNAKRREQRVQGVDQEVGVLEADEEQQIDDDGDRHDGLHRRSAPLPLDQQAEDVVRCDRSQHEQGVELFTPGIKKEARDQQPQVPALAWQEHIHPEHQRQEEKNKYGRAENHSRG